MASPLVAGEQVIVGLTVREAESDHRTSGDWRFRVKAFHADTGAPAGSHDVPIWRWPDPPGWQSIGAPLRPRWIGGSYDPEANVTFWTLCARAADPATGFESGEAVSSATVGLDLTTGSVVLEVPYAPHGHAHCDGDDAPMLVADDDDRGLAIHADRNGLLHGVDRATGTLVWDRSINGYDSRPAVPPARHRPFEAISLLQPSPPGLMDRFRMAASQSARTIFVGGGDGLMPNPCPRSFPWGDEPARPAYPSSEFRSDAGGIVAAFDLNGEPRWCRPWPAPVTGLLATAGGILFVTSADGQLAALAEGSGEELYTFLFANNWNVLSNNWNGRAAPLGWGPQAPVSFAVDGRQYIATTFVARDSSPSWTGWSLRRTVFVFGLK